MAVAELIVSRRALLAAAWPLPLAAPLRRQGPSPSSLDEQSRTVTKWNNALARFRRAEAVLAAAAHEPDEDRYNDLVGGFNNALRRLLRTPAPDFAALSTKIHLAVDHEVAELTGGEACLAALKRDASRLCSRA